jgi:signal transduction histidine kinase
MQIADSVILFIIGTLTLVVFVVFLVLIIIQYRRRQVRHITETLELKHQFQNEVLQTRLEVQEQSFRYFSEEVHDNIAQMLSLVRLKLYKTAGKTEDESIKNSVDTANELLGKTLNDLRNLSHVMNGGLVSKISLRESLEKEIAYVHDTSGTNTVLTVAGHPYEIDAERRLMVFRIVQEAIANALKHGKATRISIGLDYLDDSVTVRITDNGTGFDTKLMTAGKGLGLHNMQVRARMLGGLDIVSSPDKGTTITLKVNNDGREDKTGTGR